MTAPWHLELFGKLRATCGERAVTRFRSQKNAALLAYLALHPLAAHPRETLIELLWPEIDPEVGRTNLRSALHALRLQFEPPGIPPGSVLVADRRSAGLDPAAFTCDVAQFEHAVQSARVPDPTERARRLSAAVALYRGEFLTGLFDPWVLTAREHLAQSYVAALQQLAAAREEAGDLAGALEAARLAVTADPASKR